MEMTLNHRTAASKLAAKGQTVTAAANFVGIERTYMSRCLAGTRNFPMERLPLLADFLEVDPYELLGPADPRAAVLELARIYKVTPAELAVAS